MFFSDFKKVSILIPTWKNPGYLKLCISSILKETTIPYEIIVHVNEHCDETISYLESNNIAYTFSETNLGVCRALNRARSLATGDIIGYFNDDMVALPNWDIELVKFTEEYKIQKDSFLASTMIEPLGNNPCCVAPANHGTTYENFQYKNLISNLESYRDVKYEGVKGTTWPPCFVSSKMWDSIGGQSEEYDQWGGRGQDPDFCAKMYEAGVRCFVASGRSLVYHFSSRTVSKLKITTAHNQYFKQKFGYSIQDLCNKLERGTKYPKPQ